MSDSGKSYERPVLDNPGQLVTDGRFNFGTFGEAFRDLNPLDADKPLGSAFPKAVNAMRLKEWQAFQLGNERYFILVAIYSTKTLGICQFVVIDKETKRKYLYEKKVPYWQLHIAQGLHNTTSLYLSSDCSSVVHNDLDHGVIRLHVDIPKHKDLPALNGYFEGLHDQGASPIVICQPFDDNRALYSHKNLMPLQGNLTMGAEQLRFEAADSFMIMDDHKGFYPFTMQYDWVTGAGYTTEGELAGFNLTDNQIQDHHRYNENCLWLGDRMEVLPLIKVIRSADVYAPWQIQDEYGRVDLVFKPCFSGEVKMNFLLFKTEYYGPYGYFEGHIKTAAGREVNFEQFFGMGEKKFIQA